MRWLAVVLPLLASALPTAAAHGFESLRGELVVGQGCEAFQSFRKRTNPGGVRLEPDRRYEVLARNQASGEWLQVLVPGAQPVQRWVEETCGRLVAAGPRARGLLPFFDDVDDGPGDPSPPTPSLDPFDRAVLEVCGAWGSRPRAQTFRAMLDRPELQGEMERIHGALGGSPASLPRFKDELTSIWFAAGGFVHVFCGEPEPGGVGGLHYRGRYLQLQEEGLAGLAGEAECPGTETEIEPPIYAFGVRFRLPTGGALQTDCRTGYAYDLGAGDLLIHATMAYQAHHRAAGAEMCLHEVATPGARPYLAVFVVRGNGVRTFYPDATPACDGGGHPAGCLCGG
ncbi:MAG TPA: EndoU domain-containing protein [Geminicoccaceae bacterium]|nr:EndoU domain-containing protein [Geminicoccaceae bacterium]